MKMEKIDNPDKVREISESIFGRKYNWTNYFGIDLDEVVCYKSGDAVVLQKFFDGYSRIYVSGNNEDDIKNILSSLDGVCVLNIPTRGGIDNWENLLAESGFKLLAVYSRYTNTKFGKWASDRNIDFAVPEDIGLIEEHLNATFSKYLAHLPDRDGLLDFINNKGIIVNRDPEGNVSGAISLKSNGKSGDLPFFYQINKSGQGLAILFDAFQQLLTLGVKRVTFWVNDENKPTIKIHVTLGAKPDGMKDFIFIKQ